MEPLYGIGSKRNHEMQRVGIQLLPGRGQTINDATITLHKFRPAICILPDFTPTPKTTLR